MCSRGGSPAPGRAFTAAMAAVAVVVAACGGDAPEAPRVEETGLRLSSDSVRVWVGDIVRVYAEVLLSDGSSRAAQVEWSSTTPAVEVTGDGLVRAVARGAGRLRATGEGLEAEVPVTALPVIRGRIVSPDDGDLTPLRASWHADGAPATDAAPVAADGSFEIRASTVEPSGELAVDARAPRRYHPFLYPFHVDSLEDVTVVAVPRTWTIRSGIHRGETVETSLDPAVDDDASRLLYTYFYGQPHPRGEATTYRLDLSAWPHEGLPARVAFDHRHGSAEITPGDSAGIWGVLDRMEDVFGLDLFEPAAADPAWWPDPLSSDEPGFVPGVIRVVHDPPAWGGLPLGEGDPPTWEDDLGAWASGGRFTAFRVSRRTLSGGVLLVGDLEPLRLADGLVPWETVLAHEMLHVLGVGHTCRIPSPQGPCVRTPEPSRHDVAYMELLRETLALEREHDTFLGVVPAIIGERTTLLGRSALPTLRP